MKKTPKIKTEKQCINCGKTARSVYKNIHYKCAQCDCFFILDEKSRELCYYVLCIMETKNTYIELRSIATSNDGPYCGVIYGTRNTGDLNSIPMDSFKLLANKFLMPAELREKEKLLRCFQ